MAVVVDFTKEKIYTSFSGSSAEDISYATNFWQSIQLHPPMESRLVSSDIKQRLKVAPPSSQARHIAQSIQEEEPPALKDFMSRAKTMEHLEEYSRMQKFAEAKAQDKTLLVKHREIRKKKEELSRNKGVKPMSKQNSQSQPRMAKEEYEIAEENDVEVINQLKEFEKEKFGNSDSDSD